MGGHHAVLWARGIIVHGTCGIGILKQLSIAEFMGDRRLETWCKLHLCSTCEMFASLDALWPCVLKVQVSWISTFFVPTATGSATTACTSFRDSPAIGTHICCRSYWNIGLEANKQYNYIELLMIFDPNPYRLESSSPSRLASAIFLRLYFSLLNGRFRPNGI